MHCSLCADNIEVPKQNQRVTVLQAQTYHAPKPCIQRVPCAYVGAVSVCGWGLWLDKERTRLLLLWHFSNWYFYIPFHGFIFIYESGRSWKADAHFTCQDFHGASAVRPIKQKEPGTKMEKDWASGMCLLIKRGKSTKMTLVMLPVRATTKSRWVEIGKARLQEMERRKKKSCFFFFLIGWCFFNERAQTEPLPLLHLLASTNPHWSTV